MDSIKFYRFLGGVFVVIAFLFFGGGPGSSARAASPYQYDLYLNAEKFAIVVFPLPVNADLREWMVSRGFKKEDSGDAVFRHGTKNENGTYMMPESIQKKHGIVKFIVIQILSPVTYMVGVYDPEWGLTLPQAIFSLNELQENIPKTLEIFRGRDGNMKQTQFRVPFWAPGLLKY